jgi:hypothetical protein
MIRYLFSPPTFPLICDVQGTLIGAESPEEVAEQVAGMQLPPHEQLPLVDATGRGWVFVTDHNVVSPLTVKSRWTKKEIVAMFNNSDTARRSGESYPTRSLSARRLDRIVREIAVMVRNVNRRTGTDV